MQADGPDAGGGASTFPNDRGYHEPMSFFGFGRGRFPEEPKDPDAHPYDGTISAGTRFFVELLAWFVAPFAIAGLTHWVLGIVAAALLIGVTSVFSTPGDKQNIVVATPGPVRVLIELGLFAVALWGVWTLAPDELGIGAAIVMAIAAVTGFPRWRWLLDGAPAQSR